MTPDAFLETILNPGLRFLAHLGGPPATNDARRFLLAVAQQESGQDLNARFQGSPSSSPGPARSWFQFEAGGGVVGVLTHPSSAALAKQVCAALHVIPETNAVWRAMEGHDHLAVAFSRLLVLTDPYPIPTEEQAAWTCYCDRLWRPGKPHPENWHSNFVTAQLTVMHRHIRLPRRQESADGTILSEPMTTLDPEA